MATQQDVDYVNDCQRRVCADTGVLEKRATLVVPAAAVSVALPTDARQILAIFDGQTRLPSINPVEYMRSTTGAAVRSSARAWCVIGRTLYLTPTAPEDHTLTLFYAQRPADATSATTLEVTGEFERLVERLVGASVLLDDGQPELAQNELSAYDRDVARLRYRAVARTGQPGRVQLRGRS